MSTTFLVSPTDRDLLQALDGLSSPLPEQHGADVLVFLRGRGTAGWQRKTVDDLLASLEDSRLVRELPLLVEKTVWPILVVEGVPVFGRDGVLYRGGRPSRWTRQSWRNLLRSVHYQFGVRVEQASDLEDTAAVVREMTAWLLKPDHTSLLTRPKQTDDWGNPLDGAALQEFILQGFPRVGSKTARAIIKQFGRAPLVWTCTEEELMKVPRVGKVTAKALFQTLDG